MKNNDVQPFLENLLQETSGSLPYMKGFRNGLRIALALMKGENSLTLEPPGWTLSEEDIPQAYVPVLSAKKRKNGEIEYLVSNTIPCTKDISEQGRVFATDLGEEKTVAWQYFSAFDEAYERATRATVKMKEQKDEERI